MYTNILSYKFVIPKRNPEEIFNLIIGWFIKNNYEIIEKEYPSHIKSTYLYKGLRGPTPLDYSKMINVILNCEGDSLHLEIKIGFNKMGSYEKIELAKTYWKIIVEDLLNYLGEINDDVIKKIYNKTDIMIIIRNNIMMASLWIFILFFMWFIYIYVSDIQFLFVMIPLDLIFLKMIYSSYIKHKKFNNINIILNTY